MKRIIIGRDITWALFLRPDFNEELCKVQKPQTNKEKKDNIMQMYIFIKAQTQQYNKIQDKIMR